MYRLSEKIKQQAWEGLFWVIGQETPQNIHPIAIVPVKPQGDW